MNALRYRCPTTKNEVTTAIETGGDTLFRMKAMNLKIWVRCPHCTAGHQIMPGDTSLPDDRAASEPMLRRAAVA